MNKVYRYAQNVGLEDSQRLLEEFLASLVAVADDNLSLHDVKFLTRIVLLIDEGVFGIDLEEFHRAGWPTTVAREPARLGKYFRGGTRLFRSTFALPA